MELPRGGGGSDHAWADQRCRALWIIVFKNCFSCSHKAQAQVTVAVDGVGGGEHLDGVQEGCRGQ